VAETSIDCVWDRTARRSYQAFPPLDLYQFESSTNNILWCNYIGVPFPYRYRFAMEFPVPAEVADWTINWIKLRIYFNGGGPAPFQTIREWDHPSLMPRQVGDAETFYNDCRTGTQYGHFNPSGSGWKTSSILVGGANDDFQAAAGLTFCLTLSGSVLTTDARTEFRSVDHSGGSYAPQVIVDYEPPPEPPAEDEGRVITLGEYVGDIQV
jgi:hypothetical protein